MRQNLYYIIVSILQWRKDTARPVPLGKVSIDNPCGDMFCECVTLKPPYPRFLTDLDKDFSYSLMRCAGGWDSFRPKSAPDREWPTCPTPFIYGTAGGLGGKFPSTETSAGRSLGMRPSIRWFPCWVGVEGAAKGVSGSVFWRSRLYSGCIKMNL